MAPRDSSGSRKLSRDYELVSWLGFVFTHPHSPTKSYSLLARDLSVWLQLEVQVQQLWLRRF